MHKPFSTEPTGPAETIESIGTMGIAELTETEPIATTGIIEPTETEPTGTTGITQIIETYSPEETFALGEQIGGQCRPGQIYTLTGDLGVGKTVFTQGVARGLGITETVSSPTFTILQVYEGGRLPFYHFDVYRIADVEEMEEIGYEDCFYGEGVCLIEWADLIREILPEHYCRIVIEKEPEKGFDYRRIRIEER